LTLLVFGVSGWLFLRSFENGLRDSVDEGLRAQSATFTRQVRQLGDSLELDDAKSAVVATGEIVAQVLDERGRVIESTREAGRRSVLTVSEVRRAASARVFTDVRISREQEPFRLLAAPVSIGRSARIAVVGTSLEATDEAVDRVRDALIAGGVIAVLLTAAGAWFLAAAALRPVERMRRAAAAISARDTTARLDVASGRDEIATLGATMNELLARLQSALDRERTFVGDASHELRTPLAVLRAELDLAARPQRSIDELREAVAHAAVETDRLIRLSDALLFLAQHDADQQAIRREDVSVNDLIKRSIHAVGDRAATRGVAVTSDAETDLRASVDPELVRRAVDNLLEKARRSAPAGSTVTVHVTRSRDALTIVVLDEGPGFPPEFLPYAFERFRRADAARTLADGGSGLGLAIVREVARAHGGTARAANRDAGGATVTVVLPDQHTTQM
jgi:heavy metal sensor kinase